jgi:hypothetical protein
MTFRERLAELGHASYRDYLRSPHWQDVKRRYRASKMPQDCKVCRARWVELHHRSYRRLGNEKLHDLVPLCAEHHKGAHAYHRAHGTRGGHRSLWHLTRRYIKIERRRAERRG